MAVIFHPAFPCTVKLWITRDLPRLLLILKLKRYVRPPAQDNASGTLDNLYQQEVMFCMDRYIVNNAREFLKFTYMLCMQQSEAAVKVFVTIHISFTVLPLFIYLLYLFVEQNFFGSYGCHVEMDGRAQCLRGPNWIIWSLVNNSWHP